MAVKPFSKTKSNEISLKMKETVDLFNTYVNFRFLRDNPNIL